MYRIAINGTSSRAGGGESEIIVNVGPVAMADVPSLYRSCDGWLMATLVDSFSGTYVEAMFHRIPILTIDLDFAKGVYGDAGCHFGPHDPDDIVSKIDTMFDEPARSAFVIEGGRRVLAALPDWPHAFKRTRRLDKERRNGLLRRQRAVPFRWRACVG